MLSDAPPPLSSLPTADEIESELRHLRTVHRRLKEERIDAGGTARAAHLKREMEPLLHRMDVLRDHQRLLSLIGDESDDADDSAEAVLQRTVSLLLVYRDPVLFRRYVRVLDGAPARYQALLRDVCFETDEHIDRCFMLLDQLERLQYAERIPWGVRVLWAH